MHYMNFRGEVQNWGRRGKLPEGVSVKTYLSSVFGRLRDSPLLSVTADGRVLLSTLGELALKRVLAAQVLDEQHTQSAAGTSATEARAATEVESASVATSAPLALAPTHTQPAARPPRWSVPIASPAGIVQLGPLESLLAAIEPPPECLQGHAVALEEMRSVMRRRDSVKRKKGKERMTHKLEGAVFVAYGSSVCGFAIRGSDTCARHTASSRGLSAAARKIAKVSTHAQTGFSSLVVKSVLQLDQYRTAELLRMTRHSLVR